MTVHAAIQTKTVEYKQGDTTLEGFVAYDDAIKGTRPGVLVVHQWMGLTDYEKHRAEMLAQLGYVAFCADIYGKGVRPAKHAGSRRAGGQISRATASFCAPASTPVWTRCGNSRWWIPKHIAAIGYCFGGTTVLELARSGADIARRGQFSRRAGCARSGRRQEHQMQGAGVARRG